MPELVEAAQFSHDNNKVVTLIGTDEEAAEFLKAIGKAARYLGFSPRKKIDEKVTQGKKELHKVGVLVGDKITRNRKEEETSTEPTE